MIKQEERKDRIQKVDQKVKVPTDARRETIRKTKEIREIEKKVAASQEVMTA